MDFVQFQIYVQRVTWLEILKGQKYTSRYSHLESSVNIFDRINNNIIMLSTAIKCQFGKKDFPLFHADLSLVDF